MKKLLCVMMFGMVFGQDAITTREFEIPINFTQINSSWTNLDSGCEEGLDLSEYIDFPSGSIFEVEKIGHIVHSFESIGSEECWFTYSFGFDHFSTFGYGNNPPNIGELYLGSGTSNSGFFTSEDTQFFDCFEVECSFGASVSVSFTMIIRISGKWGNTDVGLNGDMNDDGELDVLDVVSLVQEILSGGMGDVGDLLNIVRG